MLLVEDCKIKEDYILDLHFVCRNLEKEISFDFGPSAEFAHLYSQCYELTTSEYVHTLTLEENVLYSLIIIIRYKFLLLKD